MTEKQFNIVCSFQVTASDKDQAWANFEEMVANMQANGNYLIDSFEIEEQNKEFDQRVIDRKEYE